MVGPCESCRQLIILKWQLMLGDLPRPHVLGVGAAIVDGTGGKEVSGLWSSVLQRRGSVGGPALGCQAFLSGPGEAGEH